MTYPLAQTAMFWVPIWGILLLGEKVSGLGIVGILLILFGAYSIQLKALAWNEVIRPFRNLRDPAVLAALAAGFIYSIGAVIDKTGVMLYPPFHFTFLLVFFMLQFMTLNIMRPKYRGRIMAEYRNNRLLVIAAGPVIMASFLSFRYGLQLAPMSYAVPVRQVSLLIGVLIGLVTSFAVTMRRASRSSPDGLSDSVSPSLDSIGSNRVFIALSPLCVLPGARSTGSVSPRGAAPPSESRVRP